MRLGMPQQQRIADVAARSGARQLAGRGRQLAREDDHDAARSSKVSARSGA